MSDLRFADYLDRRRATYTRDWLLLEKLKRQSAFRDATCSQDIESYLDQSDAPLGVRDIARMAWINYQVAKRKQQNVPRRSRLQ